MCACSRGENGVGRAPMNVAFAEYTQIGERIQGLIYTFQGSLSSTINLINSFWSTHH